VAVTVGAVTATGLGTAPEAWASEPHGHHTVKAPAPRNGTAVRFRAKAAAKKDPAKAAAQRTAAVLAKPTVWPAAASTILPVSAKAAAAFKATSVGKLPVKVVATAASSPSKASVRTYSRKAAAAAGVSGALFSVARADGVRAVAKARVSIDYSGFAHAYGGDYASRLTLVQLPACALTTPQAKKCRTGIPLPTTNDLKSQTLTSSVPLSARSTQMTALAATATPTSGAGSYQGTSLNPSAAWNAGGSSGDFTWSYPLSVPPAAGGPAPSLDIVYDSQSVDGRLPSTNNQPSWIGEGFDLTTGYVERSYDSCDDDGQTGKNDECWANDNATLVLGGKSTPLIKDSSTGAWHTKDDDGERITHSTGATNGDNDGEYWTVTTQDGTQYVFGKNRLPGWATGNAETNSAWTAPVYGDDSGEPGYSAGSTFSARSLTQAWRWNLDYVVDPHGNAMSYWYTKETNYYAKNGDTTVNGTAYTRGGYLSRIDYGITSSTVFGTAPDQVSFTTAERCLLTSTETCSSLTSSDSSDWPDVPFDQICASATKCTATGPTFFSRKRLTGVTTKVWDASLSTPAYRNVDSWALAQSFPDPGDGTSAGLWLTSITRTGQDGGTKTMPPVTFAGVQLYNRVDTTHDNIAALVKWRVRTITSETGSVLTVNYSDPQCVAGTTMPSSPDSDTMRCFPVYWQPPYTTDPQLDWFHKYLVTQVNESDPTGGAPLKETDYTYNGPAAWHYDSDNVTAPAKRKTWSVWRGYGSVTTTTGDAQSTRTKTVTTYFRGMNGDKLADGTTRSVSVTDSTGTSVTDSDPLAGSIRESIEYNGSTEVSGTITDQWTHQTASDGTRTANYARPAAVHTRTDIASGGTRNTTVTTTYDATTGAPTQVDDAGDTALSGDEQCTRTTYANNTSAWLMAAPTRVETVDKACGATTTRPDDVVSDVRTLYDNQSYGTAPTVGDETSTQRVSTYSGGTPTYQTVSTTTYDSQGRVLSVTDADGNATSTAYTPATGGPLTQTVTTDAKTYATTTTYDPARGLATSVIDPNSKRTDYVYDALGRLTNLWLPNRGKAAGQSASLVYTYTISNTAASVVQTGTLRNDGTYAYTYAFYDALLRPRQTQTPAPGGGRVIAQTKYDSRGLAVEQDADYTDATDPASTLANITSAIPSQTLTTYDGDARPTEADLYANGLYKWKTTTAYGGDRTTVTPPSGGIATTTLTDTLGRTTEVRQYDGGTPTGSYSSIKYTYDAKSRLTKVVDNGGNAWTYGYDLLGRKTTTTDPDAGTTSTTYTDLDQVATTTDARGKTLSYTYDALSRKTGMYDGTTQDADHQLAKWTYDSLVKGQPTSSVRYVGGSGTTGKAYITQVAAYDALYRPTSTRVVIPSVTGEEALAGTYTSGIAYNLDGTVYSVTDPAAGGLASETQIYGYNELGMPKTLSGTTGYVQNTSYTQQGDLAQATLGVSSSAKWVQITNTYEDGTRRLARQLVTDDTHSSPVDDTHYTYDNAGNPTVVDSRADGVQDTQCYRYDGHARLTTAWSATDGCAADPSTAVLGGPAPYWKSYTYDAVSDRKTETDHGTTAGAGDTTTTYTYPAAGSAQPHTLTGSTTTEPDGSTVTDSYGYDASGNTTSRTLNGKTQNLTWDDEGHLASATNSDATSASYLYDADGNRLLSRDGSGTTLYLGHTEVHLAKGTTTTTGTRYYTWAGQTIAVRTSGGNLQWVLTDPHGTADTQIDATTQAAVRTRTDPFGNARGTQPASGSWTGDRGFVNGVQDTTTGLTHLGAREYDPTTGRFISDDPVLELTDAQQIAGYAYAGDNPLAYSDPSGLSIFEGDDSGAIDSGGKGGTDTVRNRDAARQRGDGGLTHPSSRGGGGGGGGGSSHHGCGWSLSCHVSGFAHKAYTEVKEHPVIAAVVATAVVVGAVACVVATAGGCAAVIVAGATGFAEGATYGLGAAVIGGAAGAIGEGGAVIAGAVGIASAGAAAAAEGAETASAADAASDSGAGVASSRAEGTAESGSTGSDRAANAAPKPGKCSFAPSTPVLMGDGQTKPIGKIKPGDRVESADPTTAKPAGAHTVTATWRNHDHDLIDVTVRTGKGAKAATQTLHTTSKHPFYDATAHRWIPAGRLTVGHAFTAANGRQTTVVAAVKPTPGFAYRYNLTVARVHTYYVLAGANPVLVHNTCGEEGDYLYRGLPKGIPGEHAAYQDALQGRAVPKGGHSDPALHAGGNTDSEFTSWTHDYEGVALDAAEEFGVEHGLVMRIPRASIPEDIDFQIHDTDRETYEEMEHSLLGTVEGAEISIGRGPWTRPGG
jgi:RHS repeat-associated protein